jgi:hypothetical protein
MDLTATLTAALAQTTTATTEAANATAGKSGPISNETFGLWFVLLLVLGVVVFALVE